MHIFNGVSFSFFFLVFGCGISCLLQVNGNGNMWCYVCVSNVTVVKFLMTFGNGELDGVL
jgi:hypothetical protein